MEFHFFEEAGYNWFCLRYRGRTNIRYSITLSTNEKSTYHQTDLLKVPHKHNMNNEAYFSSAPICNGCQQPTFRFKARNDNLIGNERRPFYINCVDQFYCSDDTRGIQNANPACFCGRPSRRRIGGKARPSCLPVCNRGMCVHRERNQWTSVEVNFTDGNTTGYSAGVALAAMIEMHRLELQISLITCRSLHLSRHRQEMSSHSPHCRLAVSLHELLGPQHLGCSPFNSA